MCNQMRVFTILIVLLLLGCDIPNLSMDVTPSEEQVKSHFANFIIGATGIKGIYGNMDVDSTLFSYETTNKKALEQIENNLINQKWSTQKKTDSEIIFTKALPTGKGELDFNSLEIAKVSFINAKICVGYLQMDSHGSIDINSKSSEANWAIKHFWPKYEQCKNT